MEYGYGLMVKKWLLFLFFFNWFDDVEIFFFCVVEFCNICVEGESFFVFDFDELFVEIKLLFIKNVVL